MRIEPLIRFDRRTFLLSLLGVPISGTNAPTLGTDPGFQLSAELSDAGDEGHFALGPHIAIIARPASDLDTYLKPLKGSTVCLTVLKGACE